MPTSFHEVARVETFDCSGFLASASLNGGIVLPYVGWIGHRNIGDDIVFDILCNLLCGPLQQNPATALRFCKAIDRNGQAGAIDWTYADGAILGGGSTIDPFYIRKLVPGLDRKLPVFCFASGYQKDSARTEEEAGLIGLLKGARYGSVRGQATRGELMEICGSTELAAVIDGGLLAPLFYNPFALRPDWAGYVAGCAEADLPIIALNTLKLDYAVAMSVDLINRLKHRYAFALVPFDDDTLAAARAILAAVAPDCRIKIEEDFTHYASLLAVYQFAAAAINMKLHANVLCAAVGTPTIGLGGGRKMAEFFASIEASHLRATEFHANDLAERIERLEGERVAFAQRTHRLLARTLVEHNRTLSAFLAHPALAAKLARMRDAGGIAVTGLQGIDHGYIVIAPDRAETAGHLISAETMPFTGAGIRAP